MSEYSIIFSNVTKEYTMAKTMKDQFLSFFANGKNVPKFKALNDVNFKIKKGDVVGLIGLNGSGKSTAANLMIEATAPTVGSVDIYGHLELIAIGVGLNNELTGIENIRQKCFMMGMTRKEINEVMPDIIEFSELGEFIHQPLKKYSSGMRSRLGFSISIQTNPDILVVDEALSVGDKAFAAKSLKAIQGLTKSERTVVFVSHSNQQIKEFCNHVIWLDKGKVIADTDNVDEVLKAYDKYVVGFRKDKNTKPFYEEKATNVGKNESEIVLDADVIEYDESEYYDLSVKTKKPLMQRILLAGIYSLIVLLCFLLGVILGLIIF